MPTFFTPIIHLEKGWPNEKEWAKLKAEAHDLRVELQKLANEEYNEWCQQRELLGYPVSGAIDQRQREQLRPIRD